MRQLHQKKCADVRTPDRWKIVTAFFELLEGQDRLPRGAMETLNSLVTHLNLTPRTIQRIVEKYKEQEIKQPTIIRLTRCRASMCGGHGMKLTAALVHAMIRVNNENWGRQSIKKLTCELCKSGYDCRQTSVRKWCKFLGAGRRHKYIKPKLTLRHRRDRLTWVLDKFDRRKLRFSDQVDVSHGDEKWIYLLRDGTACRVSPNFEESNEGVDRIVRMPAYPKLFNNSRTPKVMFLAVTARPRIEYGFDGKFGCGLSQWHGKRGDLTCASGTVAGKTEITESVIVDAQEFCYIMLKKDGVFDAMRTKMWWFKRGSSRPDAGSTLHYLHDEAKAHTKKMNQQHWSQHRAKAG